LLRLKSAVLFPKFKFDGMLPSVWSLYSSWYELHSLFEHGGQRNAQGTEF